MADDRDFERQIERRLREYAAAESLRAGSQDPAALRSERPTPFRGLRVAGTVALGAAAALGLTVILSTARPIGQGPSPAPSGEVPSEGPTASVSPQQTLLSSASPAPSPLNSPEASEPAPSAVAIVGDVPPDGAVPPAGTSYIPGLGVEALWTELTDAGYSCQSYTGSYQSEGSQAWSIECERSVPGVEANVSAPYWTFDHIITVGLVVLPDPVEGSIGDASFHREEANRLASLEYDGAEPQGAIDWVTATVGDPACFDLPCQHVIGDVRFTIQTGERGSGSVSMDGLKPVE